MVPTASRSRSNIFPVYTILQPGIDTRPLLSVRVHHSIHSIGSFGEDDSPSFMGEDYFCESAITELSSSLAEFGKFVTVSLGV